MPCFCVGKTGAKPVIDKIPEKPVGNLKNLLKFVQWGVIIITTNE